MHSLPICMERGRNLDSSRSVQVVVVMQRLNVGYLLRLSASNLVQGRRLCAINGIGSLLLKTLFRRLGYPSCHFCRYTVREWQRNSLSSAGFPVWKDRDRRLAAGHSLERCHEPSETWVIPAVTHSHSAHARRDGLDLLQRHSEEMFSCRRGVACAPNGPSWPLHSRHDRLVT